MLSKRTYKMFARAIGLSRLIGTSSLHFSGETLLFSYNPIKQKHVRRAFNATIFWAIASLSMVIKFQRKNDVDRFNLTLAYWFAGILVTLSFALFRLYEHDLCLLMNGCCSFFRYIHGKSGIIGDKYVFRNSENDFKTKIFFNVSAEYMPNLNPDKNHHNVVLEGCLTVFGTACFLSNAFCISFLIYDPRGVIFLGELIPEKYFYLSVKLMVILYHSYLLLVVHMSILLIGGAALVYAFYTVPIYVRELRLGQRKYFTLPSLRTPENVRHVYRTLQVLQANILAVFGVFLVLNNAQCMITSLYANFVLIRYWSALETMSKGQLCTWSVLVTGYWCVILEIGRFFFERGTKVQGSWRGDKWGSRFENLQMKKFRLSCKPILLRYGTQFVIRRANVLVFMRGITRGTFRALLATKPKTN